MGSASSMESSFQILIVNFKKAGAGVLCLKIVTLHQGFPDLKNLFHSPTQGAAQRLGRDWVVEMAAISYWGYKLELYCVPNLISRSSKVIHCSKTS